MCECQFTNCPNMCDHLSWSCHLNKCVKHDLDINNLNDMILLFFIFFINIFASVSGIGGGGLLIPLYILLGNFSMSYAIPHTVLNIACSSLIRFIILFNKRHPTNSKRYLIDFSILFILISFDGNLSYLGYILNQVLPDYVTFLSILVILSFLGYKTLLKFKQQYYIENDIKNNNVELTNIYTIDGISTMIKNNIEIEIDGITLNIDKKTYSIIKKWFQFQKRGENKHIRYVYLFVTFMLSMTFFLLSYFRQNIKKCSDNFNIYLIFQILLTSFFSFLFGFYVYKNYKYRKQNNFLFLKGDINWNLKNLVKFSLFGTITGIISTYLGIGGGMLVTPFLLSNNILPEVVIATNSVSTFFSASISTSQYIFTGQILFNYGIYTSLLSMLGSYIGLKTSHIILKKINRKSFITFILFVIILLSEILLIISNWNINIFQSKFKNFCI